MWEPMEYPAEGAIPGAPARWRDHYTEAPGDWVGGASDRGIRHSRNDDALAVSARSDHAVLIVCDGVSSAAGSDAAALDAARVAVQTCDGRLDEFPGDLDARIGAAAEALTDAVQTANEVVVGHSDPRNSSGAACTFAAAVAFGDTAVHASIGDSRIYWVADHGEAELLSVDDSMAQVAIDAGVSRAEAETGPGCHAITKWLGRDAPDLSPSIGILRVPVPGWLVVCSDGLWNYASEPQALAEVLRGYAGSSRPAAVDLAEDLVNWACARGGHDNVTVVLARLGDPHPV